MLTTQVIAEMSRRHLLLARLRIGDLSASFSLFKN